MTCRYKWCCFKARFIGTFITDAETGEPIHFRAAVKHIIPYLIGRSYND